MNIKAVSGIILMVSDAHASADFYEDLGFTLVKKEQGLASVRSNWFWIDFVVKDKHTTGGDGQWVYIGVEDVDKTYEELQAKKLQPTEPQTFSTKRRETCISDPDGYKLVFFTKK